MNSTRNLLRIVYACCSLLLLSGAHCLADSNIEVSIDSTQQDYRRIRIYVDIGRDSGADAWEVWFADTPFVDITNAQLHSTIRVDDTFGLEAISQGEALDDCWSDGRPIHRDADGGAVVERGATNWSCNLSGMLPGQEYWIAVVPVDKSGAALVNTAALSPIKGRTDATDVRTPPPDTRPIAVTLLSIVTLAVVLLIYLRRRDSRLGRHQSRLAHAYVAPAMIALAVLSFYPVLYGIWLAFTNADQSRLGGESFIGLANFLTVMTSEGLWRVTVFTFVWALANVLAHVSIGLALALALNRANLVGRTVYRTVLLLPWAIPAYISVLAWKGMLQSEGLVNAVLGTSIDFLADVGSARMFVILVNIWLGVPFMMMTLSGALQAIPKDMFEAADVEGVSRWRKFAYLTLPNLKSTLVPVSLLAFIFTFNNFATIYLMTRGDPVVGFGQPGATDILVTYVFRVAFEFGRYGLAAAWSVLIFLMLIVFSWIYMKKSRAAEEVA